MAPKQTPHNAIVSKEDRMIEKHYNRSLRVISQRINGCFFSLIQTALNCCAYVTITKKKKNIYIDARMLPNALRAYEDTDNADMAPIK